MSLFVEDFYLRNKWEIFRDGPCYQNSSPRYVQDKSITDIAFRIWNQEYPSASEEERIEARTLTANHPIYREYLNESIDCLWLKCTGIFVAGLIVHPIATAVHVIGRLFRCLAFLIALLGSVFGIKTASKYVSEHTIQAMDDLFKIVSAPLGCVALILSPLYGMMSPILAVISELPSALWTEDSLAERMHDMLRDSRKIYATFERAMYGASVIAPCFQPRRCGKPVVPHLFLGLRAHLFGGKANAQNSW